MAGRQVMCVCRMISGFRMMYSLLQSGQRTCSLAIFTVCMCCVSGDVFLPCCSVSFLEGRSFLYSISTAVAFDCVVGYFLR